MAHKITLILGDGIGPEVIRAACKCIEATGVKIDWEEAAAGQEAEEKYGQLLPESTLDSIKRNKIALKGPIITPIGEGFRSVNVALRQTLDLYACLRPAKSYSGVKSLYKDIDLVVVRENTEDLYAGIEFQADDPKTKEIIKTVKKYTDKEILSGSAISLKPISKIASEKIVRFAFEYALKNKRKVYLPEKKEFEIVNVYDGHKLKCGNRIIGPGIIEQVNTTTFVSSGYNVVCDKYGSYTMYLKTREKEFTWRLNR